MLTNSIMESIKKEIMGLLRKGLALTFEHHNVKIIDIKFPIYGNKINCIQSNTARTSQPSLQFKSYCIFSSFYPYDVCLIMRLQTKIGMQQINKFVNYKMVKVCLEHNLPQDVICVGEQCYKRIGCKLCVDKHEHKFFLDTKTRQRPLRAIQESLEQKIFHLKKYTKANITHMKLDFYREKIQEIFKNQHLYFESKLQQEILNFNLWIEKITNSIQSSLNHSKKLILDNWQKYKKEADKHLESIQEYETLGSYFKKGDWTAHSHIDRCVGFLYSEEMLYQFNRRLDGLKRIINFHKRQDKQVTQWFLIRRLQFSKFEFCPHETFEKMIDLYKGKPEVSLFQDSKLKNEEKNRTSSILDYIQEGNQRLLIYPQITYEPFQNIHKIIRYDNQIFATSGGRSINFWTKVSTFPQKTYPVNFPTYGLISFVELGKDDPEKIIYGKSNGEMGLIDFNQEIKKQMPAHDSTIRDIIQFDSYHFLTASQDWSMKLWSLNNEKTSEKTKYFASERLHLKGHSGKLHCLCKFGPNVLSAGADGTIKLWDIIRQSYDELYPQEKQVHALAEIRHQLFASGGDLKQLLVWDYRKVKTPSLRFPLDYSCNSILCYDINTIIFSDKNIVKAVDIRNFRQPLLRFKNDTAYTHSINSIQFLSDSEIGMGGSDNFISVWKY